MKWQLALRFQTGGIQADSPEISDRRRTADFSGLQKLHLLHKHLLFQPFFSFSFLNSEVCVLTYFIFFIFAWSTAQKVWKLVIVSNCHKDKHALTPTRLYLFGVNFWWHVAAFQKRSDLLGKPHATFNSTVGYFRLKLAGRRRETNCDGENDKKFMQKYFWNWEG